MTAQDQLRARAIECLMCEFTLDLNDLASEFGAQAFALEPSLRLMAERFFPYAVLDGRKLTIAPEGQPLTRMIASVLDQHVPEGVRYSRAS